MKKTRILALVLAVVMLLALCGCGNKAEEAAATGTLAGKNINDDSVKVKVGYVSLSTAGITNTVTQPGLYDTVSMYPNVEVTIFDGQYDPTTQNNYIQECITQGYDAIIMECIDADALNNSITEAEKAGIPVITINCGCTCLHSMHIQGADYGMGFQGGEYLCKALEAEGGGNIVILDVPAANAAIARQYKGFQDAVAQFGPNCKIVDHQNIDMFSTDIANTTMSDLLTKYDKNIQAVYGASDDIALGAVQAIEAAGIAPGTIKVWGGTGYMFAFNGIKDGSWYGTSWCDSYNQYAVAMSYALMYINTGATAYAVGMAETPTVYQPMFAVTKDNVDSIIPISRWELY